jgi:hypothetical protein
MPWGPCIREPFGICMGFEGAQIGQSTGTELELMASKGLVVP